MKITLKLFASLRDYLPEEENGLGTNIEIPEGSTANEVIDCYHIPRSLTHLVLVNGVYMAPAARDTTSLKDGDTLAIWPPVAGG